MKSNQGSCNKLNIKWWLLLVIMAWFGGSKSSFAQLENNEVEGLKIDSSQTRLQEFEELPIVTIDEIFILGNNRTKPRIIHRELGFQEGDQIFLSSLKEQIQKDRRKLMNTELFLDVNFNIVDLQENKVDIIVRVAERWYTVPSPILKLADRNFNDWIQNQNRDLNRLEYGVKFFQYNFRGLDERLYLYSQFGFTNQYSIKYVVPYVDKAQKNGISVDFSYWENNDIAFKNEGNKLIYTENAKKMRTNIKSELAWNHRSTYYTNHSLSTSFRYSEVKDTIFSLNPDYYLDNDPHQRSINISYQFDNDHRDFVSYPLKGYHYQLEFSKLGIGLYDDVNIFSFEGHYSNFFDLGNDYYFAGKMGAYLSTPHQRPYEYNYGLGYNDNWPRGFELYVVEGQNHFLQQSTLRKKIFSRELYLEPLIPLDQFNNIPLSIYLKTYFDSGYSYNKNSGNEKNLLANRYLYTGGLGLDIVSFYGLVMRFEYSFNSLGEKGLFFHFSSPF